MNYEQTNFWSRFLWVIWILVIFAGITTIHKYQPPMLPPMPSDGFVAEVQWNDTLSESVTEPEEHLDSEQN